MEYEWDDDKRRRNLDQHGIDFVCAEKFDWSCVVIREDNRRNYGETRYFAMAPIGKRLFSMVYTLRGDKIRIINLRKANRREIREYEEKIQIEKTD